MNPEHSVDEAQGTTTVQQIISVLYYSVCMYTSSEKSHSEHLVRSCYTKRRLSPPAYLGLGYLLNREFGEVAVLSRRAFQYRSE